MTPRIQNAIDPKTPIIFMSSFSLIVFEIFLTRLFSVLLDYSFVFLVISLATLGIGLGGYAAYRWHENFDQWMHFSFGIFSVSLIGIVFLIYVSPFFGIVAYSLIALLPFLLGGYLMAGIFQTRQRDIDKLYFLDLLGAGLGVIGAILLMNVMQPVQTIGLLSFFLFVVYYVWNFPCSNRWNRLINSLILFAQVFNLVSPFVNHFEFSAYESSPYSIMYQQADAELVYTDWNAFSRTDVYDADDELLYMTIDGGAVSPISKFSGDWSEVDYLMGTTASLAFIGNAKGKVLIIGSGGGQEVLTATMNGYKEITAVDINKASFEAVHKLAPLTGDIYRLPNVKAVVADGRSYIRKTSKDYDLIFLSLVTKKSESTLGLTLTENYLYTKEALQEYMTKISERGQLAFLLHDEFELNNIMHAIESFLKEEGIPNQEFGNYIGVIETYQHLGYEMTFMGENSISRPLMIVKKQPFEASAAQDLYNAAVRIQQLPLHIPFVLDRYQPIRTNMDQLKNDWSANRDDKPFFYSKSRGLPFILIVLLIIALLMAWMIAKQSELNIGNIIYFSCTAVGFMLIEITLIQKFILPLGHSALSFALVLGLLLTAGGLGSYFSERIYPKVGGRFFPLFIIGLMTFLLTLFLEVLDPNIFAMSLKVKLAISALLLFPLGLFLGMPFPYGLRRLDNYQTAAIWGFSGVMNVVGSIFAPLFSLTLGFNATLIIGALIYLTLYIVQPKLSG